MPWDGDKFGAIKSGDQLDNAVIATLKLWFPTYIAEAQLQRELSGLELPAPRSYEVLDELVSFPENKLPAVVLINPGFAQEPRMDGGGSMVGYWRLGIGICNSAPNRSITSRNNKIYAAVIRAILLQKRSLGGFASGVDFIHESYEDTETARGRSFSIATLEMVFEVPGIVDLRAGPTEAEPSLPGAQPGSDWTTVETTDVDVDAVALPEPLQRRT